MKQLSLKRTFMFTTSKILLISCNILFLSILLLGDKEIFAQALERHVHGKAELNIVLVDRQLQLDFISPAMNLLGFEHAPISAREKAMWEKASTDLQTNDWLVGDAFAGCQAATVAFESPRYGDAHEHVDKNQMTESHANFHIQYLLNCPMKPAAKFSITAFDRFTGVEEITVQWITETNQGLTRLTPTENTLILE